MQYLGGAILLAAVDPAGRKSRIVSWRRGTAGDEELGRFGTSELVGVDLVSALGVEGGGDRRGGGGVLPLELSSGQLDGLRAGERSTSVDGVSSWLGVERLAGQEKEVW